MENNTNDIKHESIANSPWDLKLLKNLWRFKVHCKRSLLSKVKLIVMSQERQAIGAAPLKDQ